MSIQIKKKSKLYRVLENNELSDILIFGFLINDIKSLICLDKIIGQNIMGRIRHRINYINSQIKSVFKDIMPIYQNRQNFNPQISRNKKGQIKLEIPIYFAVNLLKKQKCYTFSYSYQLQRKNKKQKYIWSAQFQVISKQDRNIWILQQRHKNKCLPLYTGDVQPVRATDLILIKLPISIAGRVIHKLKLYPLQLQSSENILKQYSLTHNSFKNMYESKRDCQLDKIYDWINCKQINQQIKQLLFHYTDKYFKITGLYTNEFQKHYKVELVCEKQGNLKQNFGINSMILRKQSEGMAVQLKRKGSYLDPQNKLKLRIGDNIKLYLIQI